MRPVTDMEDYAVDRRVAPSDELEAAIERLLAEGLADAERLTEIGRLGARLAIQRAVEAFRARWLALTALEHRQLAPMRAARIARTSETPTA